jgi:hypothetical protein
MRWLPLPALALVAAAACTDGPIFEISDAKKVLADAMAMPDYSGWSTTGGSLSLSPTGNRTYPSPMTLRMRVYELCGHDDGDECAFDLVKASVKVVVGSPCHVTVPMSCEGSKCFGEVEVTGLGNCLLQTSATTSNGQTESACWYHAEYEADDPFDDARFAQLESQTNREVDDCRDDL